MAVSVYNMIVSEGNIFLLIFKKNKIIAEIMLNDGSGKIIFPVSKYQISKYLFSELTINGLLAKSLSKTVEYYDRETKTTTIIDKSLVGELSCGPILYNDLSRDMIMSFPERIELAALVSYSAVNYDKIMEYVRQYFYLKEKYEVIVLIYGENCPISQRYYKQLIDLNHFMHDFEIPIDYAHPKDIVALKIERASLENDYNLYLDKIAKKDIFKLSNIEMNYLAYRLSNLIADLKIYPRFWTKRIKLLYLKDYANDYFPYTRNITIDDILE